MDAAKDVQNLSPAQLTEYLQSVSLCDVADVISEAGIDGKTFVGLSREDITDLIAGVQIFLLRNKMIRHIMECSGDSGNEAGIAVGSSPLLCQSTQFSLYTDSDLIRCNQESEIDTTTKDICVRAVISNMISACQSATPARYPNAQELQQMAITMCHRFPVLNDDKDINREKPWEGFLLKLKRRLANKKPVKKPQGANPNKSRKRLRADLNDEVPEADEPTELADNDNDNDETLHDYDAKLMAIHYKKLKEKMSERNPNQRIIMQLLDLEFPARRRFVEAISSDSIKKLLDAYPCFQKSVHIVDEIRRHVRVEDDKYLESCARRADNVFEQLYLYGISLGQLSPCQSKSEKEKKVLLKLTSMFPGRKSKVHGFLTEIQNEDIQSVITREKDPHIISTPTNILVTADGQTFAILKTTSWTRALLVFLGIHYTFMLPYNKCIETAMTFMQMKVLGDEVHCHDMTKEFKFHVRKFNDFVA